MKEIPLTQGKVAIVDDEDFERVSQFKWFYLKVGYAGRQEPAGRHPKTGRYMQRLVYMHRFIANTPDGMKTDHANGNKLDNRRANLRACDDSQNQANRRRHPTLGSGYKGVSRQGRRWVATCAGRYVGSYDTPEEAHAAYMDAAVARWGSFANPGDVDPTKAGSVEPIAPVRMWTGGEVKALRARFNLSGGDLSRLLGIPLPYGRSMVSRWEHGHVAPPARTSRALTALEVELSNRSAPHAAIANQSPLERVIAHLEHAMKIEAPPTPMTVGRMAAYAEILTMVRSVV